MDPERPRVGAECALVRQQLPDLVSERLDETRADELRQHLIECEPCSELLADLVLEDVSRRPAALPPPPFVPPIEVYEAFLRARKTRFGTLWKLVREGVDAADGAVREWAVSRRETVGRALGEILSSRSRRPMAGGGEAMRVRAAIRTRGVRTSAVRSERTPTSLVGEVVTSDSQPAGASVQFQVVEPPHITEDGRFRVRLQTEAPGYVGQIALCTIDLGSGEPVSFTGVLGRRPDADVCEVQIDEASVAAVAGEIPLERISLFVTRP